MRTKPAKTPIEEFEEKAGALKAINAVVKITTNDPKPYDVIVGRIIKLEKNWITLRRVPKLSDGKFPDTYTGDVFSLNYTIERDINIKNIEG